MKAHDNLIAGLVLALSASVLLCIFSVLLFCGACAVVLTLFGLAAATFTAAVLSMPVVLGICCIIVPWLIVVSCMAVWGLAGLLLLAWAKKRLSDKTPKS